MTEQADRQGGEAKRRRLVFISHGSGDTWIARQIAREIERAGAETFLDATAIDVGHDFIETIRGFLRRADELVVLWTPSAVGRVFVNAEVASAWILGIPIIQILSGVTAGELVAHPDFPPFLRTLHMIDINDIDTYFDQLRRRVGEARRLG